MGDALQGLRTSLDPLANVPDNRLALDYPLAEQGGAEYAQLLIKPAARMSLTLVRLRQT